MITTPLLARMYSLSEEQAMLRDTVRDYADEKIVPVREELDRARRYPRAIHGDLVELGILGMSIPDEYGGLGMGGVEAALVYEELGRGCAGVATAIGANLLGIEPLLFFGTPEQKARFLPKVAAGALAAYAITEPGAGTDAGGIRTIAEPLGDDRWRLRGQKTFITGAGIASLYTIFALTDPDRGPRGVSCFLVEVDPDRPPPGIGFSEKFDKMGINASETREILLDGLEVRTSDIIGGKPGRGFLQAMGVFDNSRPMIGSIGVGLARAAFEAALRYAHERTQFGQPIIHFSGLRQMFVDMWLRIEGARAMVIGGARRVDRRFHGGSREDVTAWAAMAKFVGSEASRVTLDALQATGGYGYINETPFPKMVRDHKILEIFEGTNQIQREQVGRQFGQAFQKNGTAMPADLAESFALGRGLGGEQAELAWRVADATMAQVFAEDAPPILRDHQETHWVLAEMVALAESSRLLAEACGRADVPEEHFVSALGQTYARESLLGVAARADRLLRAGPPGAHAPAAAVLEEARNAASGLFALRDRVGAALLDANVG